MKDTNWMHEEAMIFRAVRGRMKGEMRNINGQMGEMNGEKVDEEEIGDKKGKMKDK